MIGRLITAILVIAAAAVVTMERETAEVADMSATLAESKYADAEERAARYEGRAREAEAKAIELEAHNAVLAKQLRSSERGRRLALFRGGAVLDSVQTSPPEAKAALKKLIDVNIDAQRACFGEADIDDPAVFGRFLRLRVVTRGEEVRDVIGVGVIPGLKAVEACLADEMRNWDAPPTPKGHLITVATVTWQLPVDG